VTKDENYVEYMKKGVGVVRDRKLNATVPHTLGGTGEWGDLRTTQKITDT